jgi:hypothetical protein
MVNAENVSAGVAASRDPVVTTSTSASNNTTDALIGGLVDLKSSLRLTPKSPDKCPVFAVFYAEFDIKKGPVVRYQSPKNFLDRDINTTTAEIHEILEKTFERLKVEENNANVTSNRKHQEGPRDDDDCDVEATCTNDDSEVVLNSSPKNSKKTIGEIISSTKQRTTKEEQEQHRISSTSTAESHSSNNMQREEEDNSIVDIIEKNNDGDGDIITLGDEVTSDDEVNLPEGVQSIFDSTSEYIITGSELTGKIITLSTHDVHVMTRPTQITNEKYERNSLLFSIGMVLRRAADPRPFRPLISKLAMTLRSMEIESGILSDPIKIRRTIQPLLERILISMNSPRWECNLLLDRSTSLNLKLFHPPKPPASPVHNYQVPVLLVRDFQLGYYEWDLAINWVILHIDGITNARQISVKAEVDLEMVLACLRVLKHHGIISVVDMFLYTNRYECTERAAAMLTGKEDKLLQEAIDFAVKRPQQQAVHLVPPPVPSPRTVPTSTTVSSGGGSSDLGNTAGSPKSGTSPYLGSIPSSSYPPRSLNLFGGGGGSQRNTNFRHMMTASSIERDQASFLEGAQRHLEDRRHLKAALAELYCGCNRNLSFGDLWLSLTTELPNSLTVPNLNNKTAPVRRESGLSSNYQRSVSTRKDSLTEYDMSENEVVAFSPMESSYLESLRYRSSSVTDEHKNNNTGKIPSSSSPININWNEIFKEFDHRRFITFGVVNGLLIRVHSYPFFLGPFPERRRFTASLVLPPESTRLHVNKNTIEEKNFHFAKAVANMMDGTRFDDELVCAFEKPFNQLVELVEKYSGKKVAHIFA